jgi:hypothetical protein
VKLLPLGVFMIQKSSEKKKSFERKESLGNDALLVMNYFQYLDLKFASLGSEISLLKKARWSLEEAMKLQVECGCKFFLFL